jgi:hypothetical protein
MDGNMQGKNKTKRTGKTRIAQLLRKEPLVRGHMHPRPPYRTCTRLQHMCVRGAEVERSSAVLGAGGV